MIDLSIFNKLGFDEKSHTYRLDGIIRCPSVTEIMNPLSSAYYKGVDNAYMSVAAKRGSDVHHCIENYWLYGCIDIPKEYAGYIEAFMSFVKERKPKPLAVEVKFFHKYLYYAGTADLLCTLDGNDGENWLIDYKTTSSINAMLTRVQLEGYRQGLESHKIPVGKKAILQLKNNGTYRLADGYEKDDIESWETFNALLTVHRFLSKYKNN